MVENAERPSHETLKSEAMSLKYFHCKDFIVGVASLCNHNKTVIRKENSIHSEAQGVRGIYTNLLIISSNLAWVLSFFSFQSLLNEFVG